MRYYTYVESPIDPIMLVSDGVSLAGLYMDARRYDPGMDDSWIEDATIPPFPKASEQLAAYFEGTLTQFDVPLSMEGSDFQQHVWNELLTIPFGTTTSYGELAKRLDNPNGSRAVGLANGRNPISIIVPCHRVIGADGRLTGYGGGLPRKAALLAFEAAIRSSGPRPFAEISTVPEQLGFSF
ncbi:methylated-DNA--[protein]-cysteine S-methyltransferase [Chloroflexi bacterium TSY]|nr:methylated-DNA--[protein]-cysteine S-methyltransferase [Chloroflexi bacterium TSY]